MNHLPTTTPRSGWRPVLRPIASIVIAAQLLLALQPLSVLAQDGQAGASPAAQAQIRRLAQWQQRIEQGKIDQARAGQAPGSRASERTSGNLTRVHQLLKGIQTRAGRFPENHRPKAGTPAAPNQPQPQTERQNAQELAQLGELLGAIDADTDAVLADFAALRQPLLEQRVGAEILARHDQAQAELERRARQLRELIGQWRQAPAASVLDALNAYFERYPATRHSTPVDPAKLPWSTPQPNLRPPAESKLAWWQNLYRDQAVQLAQAGGSGSGSIHFDIPPEPGQAPNAADLAETEDAPLSETIKAQAAELKHNPVEIARWVRNNVIWVPTWGSVQGAELTLLNQRGNAVDIASLTVALLRASGIPARYVIGTIEIDAARLRNWSGDASNTAVALDLLQQGGIAARAIAVGGNIEKIHMEHAWVKAYVNWTPGRGSRQGGAAVKPSVSHAGLPQHPHPNAKLNAWVDIDTSYKQYTFTQPLDIAAAVPLDTDSLHRAVATGMNIAQGYVEGLSQSAAMDQIKRYRARVDAYLDTQPDLSLGDLVKSRTSVSDMQQLLAGVPPFPTLATQQLSVLPATLRHAVVLNLYASAFERAQENPQLTWRVSLPALGVRRLGVTYEPASASDARMLDGLEARGATSFPAYLLNLRPTLQIDGVNMATAPVVRAGAEQAWSISFEDPSGVNSASFDCDNTAGDEIVFAVNGNGIGADAVMSRIARGQTQTAAGNLEQAALLYWLEHDQFDQMSASHMGVLTTRLPSVIQMSAPLTVHYFYGIARSASYQSRRGDAKRVLIAAAAQDAGKRRQFMVQAGIQGSAIEGSVLDQLLDRSDETSASTTQLLAIAARQGQRIYGITQDNVASALPALAISEDVKQDIRNAVTSGMVAFVHEKEITNKGYTGVGYIILNPDSGAAGYLIDGGKNGLIQPSCFPGVRPPAAEISVSTVLKWETIGPTLVGFAAPGDSTEAERKAAQIAREAIAKAGKSAAQRLAARLGPRLLAAFAVPGANVILGVSLVLVLAIEIYMLVEEIKMLLHELEIQPRRVEVETQEEVGEQQNYRDSCYCRKNPADPKCSCKKIPVPHQPKMPPDASTKYNRQVIFHHQCADNSGNSYPGNDVDIFGMGEPSSVDLFNNITNTACEVKTSFRDTPYKLHILKSWRNKVAKQIDRQAKIAKHCKWKHCVIVNKSWLKTEIENVISNPKNPFTTVYLRPSCAQPIEDDPFENPIPELD